MICPQATRHRFKLIYNSFSTRRIATLDEPTPGIGMLNFTALKFPKIIYGSTSLGNLYVAIPDNIQLAIVREWIAHSEGTLVIDSAGKYGAGLALENIGRHLRSLNVSPNDVVISNKLGWRRSPLTTPEPTFEPGVWVNLEYDAIQDISYDGILRCYEEGCELLGDYRPQLLSVHDPDEYLEAATDETDLRNRWDDISGAYDALTELKQAGEVAGIGVGAKTWTTIKEFTDRYQLDWVMVANSFTVHSHPRELVAYFDQLGHEGISIINSAVFNGGYLVGGEFYNYRSIDPDSSAGKALIEWRRKFFDVCDQFSVKPAEACVVFGTSHPAICSIALSSSKPERVASNASMVSKELSTEFWDALRERHLIDIQYPYL